MQLSETQRLLRETARKLAADVIAPRAAEIDRSEEYPQDNVEALKQAGLLGMTIPQEYGGQGLGHMEAVLVIEELAKVCGVTARIAVETNMGAIAAIMEYGKPAQKKQAADLVLAGDKPAICITEPGAGSAATEMTTRADTSSDGYIINGTKHWITGGGVSKLHLVFARVFDDGKDLGIAGFMVIVDPVDSVQGLKIGRREPTMGLRGIPETEIIFDDLHVGPEALISPPEGIARGFGGLMRAYNGQRVGAATVALGIAQGAFDLALDYVQQRHQFGRPIAEFQGLQWMLADMSIGLEAARSLIHKAADCPPDGFPDQQAAAQAKIFASETAIKVTNDALQMFGAAGYSRNLALERMARDARMFTIGGGTAQVLRTLVASKLLGRKLPQTRDGYL